MQYYEQKYAPGVGLLGYTICIFVDLLWMVVNIGSSSFWISPTILNVVHHPYKIIWGVITYTLNHNGESYHVPSGLFHHDIYMYIYMQISYCHQTPLSWDSSMNIQWIHNICRVTHIKGTMFERGVSASIPFILFHVIFYIDSAVSVTRIIAQYRAISGCLLHRFRLR